jgi:hypothetical protein
MCGAPKIHFLFAGGWQVGDPISRRDSDLDSPQRSNRTIDWCDNLLCNISHRMLTPGACVPVRETVQKCRIQLSKYSSQVDSSV